MWERGIVIGTTGQEEFGAYEGHYYTVMGNIENFIVLALFT
jgi:hypothetical protein